MASSTKRLTGPDALFSRLTEERIAKFVTDERLKQTLREMLAAATRAKWCIHVNWQQRYFTIINEENQAVSDGNLSLTVDAVRVAGQCAALVAPAEKGLAGEDLAPTTGESLSAPMNKASDYWNIGFEATARILSARVERTGGSLSYGVYGAYPEGYFAYYRNGYLSPDTALNYGKKHNSDKNGVYLFPWEQLQEFLDLLQNDEGILAL